MYHWSNDSNDSKSIKENYIVGKYEINRLNFKKFCGLAQEVLLNSFFPKCLKTLVL